MTAHRYHVFAGCLESEVPLDGLPSADADWQPAERWHLRLGAVRPHLSSSRPIGEERVTDAAMLRCHAIGDGLYLDFDDTGAFHVERAGRRITWYPPASVDARALAADVAGRVMATALHLGGEYVLHASAVAWNDGAVAFLAPKHHGKSTLAAAAVRGGAAFLSDDTLGVRIAEGQALARPGIPEWRLWPEGVGLGPKTIEREEASRALVRAHRPLSALYLLEPRASAAGDPVRRVRLPDTVATMALVSQAKLGDLLGAAHRHEALARAAAIASRVTVYRLEVARDADRLPAVCRQLEAWVTEDAGVAA